MEKGMDVGFNDITKENFEEKIFERGNVAAIYGAQLGDEGKGKVTSLFKNVDYVAVPTGGANAGHTVVCKNGKEISLHELPGGAVIENAKIYVGQGRVVNITGLKKEIQELESNGIPMKGRIILAGNAQIILTNLQRKLDIIIESLKNKKVGTTAKGIGPGYGLKGLRTGITANTLLGDDKKIVELINVNTKLFPGLEYREIREECEKEQKELLDLMETGYVHIDDSNMRLNDVYYDKKRILVECSQSALLALDGGMYPYCTSSDTSVNGINSALNLPEIHTRIAVFKAIKSKVGGGFFPTKFEDETFASMYRDLAGEYGRTTKRPRDVGYFDAVEGRKVMRTNKTDILFLTKCDMLSVLENTAKIGIGYHNTKGNIYHHHLPTQEKEYKNLTVEWSKLFNLSQDIKGIDDAKKLPEEYKSYIDYMLAQLDFQGNVLLGTGPKPEDYFIYK